MSSSTDVRGEEVHVQMPASVFTVSRDARGQPPNYAEVTAEPPSYESLFGKLKKAKSESTSKGSFIKRSFKLICCGSISVMVFLVLAAAIPIAQLIMGIIHKDDCPVEEYIPIYNIVGGVFGILFVLINLCNRFRKKVNGDEYEDEYAPWSCCDMISHSLSGLFCCFILPWFIAGSVWVYRLFVKFHVSYVDTDLNYCQRDLYLFTFWSITAVYILIAVGSFFLLCGAAVIWLCVTVGNDDS